MTEVQKGSDLVCNLALVLPLFCSCLISCVWAVLFFSLRGGVSCDAQLRQDTDGVGIERVQQTAESTDEQGRMSQSFFWMTWTLGTHLLAPAALGEFSGVCGVRLVDAVVVQ
jgi:hypothetical protein